MYPKKEDNVMNYKYEIVDYDRNIPAKIMYLTLSSHTHKTELHWHREPELVYVVSGKAECKNNGESFILGESEFFFSNSEDVHLVRPAEGSTATLVFIQLSYEYMRAFCRQIDNVVFNINSSGDANRQIADVLRNIAQTDAKAEYSTLMQISNINRLYYLLFRYCLCCKRADAVIIPKRDYSYAKIALNYINKNFRRELTLGEISAVVNLSPSYFSKYFKNITQVSFSEYLASLRLEAAIQDMLLKNSTVSAAAFDNGFANVKAFITQCKKIYGCTPARYKKITLNK